MEKTKIYALTNAQRSILLTENYYKSTSINNVVGRIKFKEKIDAELLKRTLELIIQQNEALRTRIVKIDGEYYQYFIENADNEVEIIDIEDSNEEKKVKELSRKHIPIINKNLMRFYILKYKDDTADVLSVSHHIVADAWTVSMYAKEIIRIYQKLKRNEEIERITYSYSEYIAEEEEYLKSDKINEDKKYWDAEYEEEPTTQFFSVCNNIRGKREHYIIAENIAKKIKDYCKENRISEQCLFMSTFITYLSKIASSDNISIGMPVLNRRNFRNKNTMGMFISTLPFHIKINTGMTIKEFLKYVNEKQFSFLKHHRYPYELLQKDIKERFSTNQKSYSVAFSYQNAKIENSEDMNCITSWEFNGYCPDDLQIHISDMQNTGTFNVYYDYKYNGLEKKEIKNIHNRLLYIIEQIIENKVQKIRDIEIITETEKEQLVYKFNDTEMEYDKNISICERISQISKKYPKVIAVKDEKEQLTYEELENKSNILANELINKGIGQDDIVGILFGSKKNDVIISMLAVLKVGASFISLYYALPEERIKFILQDSKAKAIITEKQFVEKYDFLLNIDINNIKNKQNLEVNKNINIESLAYLIYTSGTTGKPKGTGQTHKNLVNFIYSFYNILDKEIGNEDKFLSLTNVSFDVSIAEIFTPLFFGATLYLYKDLANSTVAELVEYIVKNKITFAYFPPSMLEDVAEKMKVFKDEIALNKMLVGVEPIKNTTLEKFVEIKEDIHIINGYGPSETTICSTMYDFNKRNDIQEIVPIGKPIKNTQIYIMNKDLNILPVNTIGEIYILGDGVGKGYIFNNELNCEKYIEIEGEKAFKTGDLGKWTEDGNIIFVGRDDAQIKFRGYRIDLGEIENTLKSFNEVQNAVVILQRNGKEEKMIAFVIMNEKNVIEESLRDYLSKILPYYMMPSKFIKLDKFPMNVNGKIDKKQLIEIAQKQEKETLELPKTYLEKQIYNIIQEKIKNTHISINDNFFDLGIDSIEAISLIVEFEKRNIKFLLQDFYNYPTIKLLAKKIENEKNTEEKVNEQQYIKSIQLIKKETKTIDGNILLLGSTGYLGSHLLEQLIKQTNKKIYCLVRAKSNEKAKERLFERMTYYFGEEFCDNNEERIIPINGDFTLQNFGMSNRDYEKMKMDISIIINSAACVKHFGNTEYFYNINCLSVSKALEFCKKENKQFIQISTMSIFDTDSEIVKDESIIYYGQSLENIYIKTKFDAEQEVIKAIKEGVDATIFRLGNIMWRYSDGLFQINETENSFIAKLKSIIQNKVVLRDMLEYKVDLSPVDLCAEAIIKILLNNQMNIYHIENNNKVTIKQLVETIKKMGINIQELDRSTYSKAIINNVENKNELMVLLENETEQINVNSEKSINYLKEQGFKWNIVNEEYIKKYILNL